MGVAGPRGIQCVCHSLQVKALHWLEVKVGEDVQGGGNLCSGHCGADSVLANRRVSQTKLRARKERGSRVPALPM